MLWNSENISCHHKVLCGENSNTDMGLLLIIRIAVERRCIRPRYNPSGSQSANLAHLLLPRALSIILNEFRECLLFRFGSELQVKCYHILLSRSLAEYFLALFLRLSFFHIEGFKGTHMPYPKYVSISASGVCAQSGIDVLMAA